MTYFTGSVRCAALCIAVLMTVSMFTPTDAKRGCSSFGHSCFGGHGKRSEGRGATPFMGGDGQEEIAAPRTGYPHISADAMSPEDDIIPIRSGGFMESGDESFNIPEQLKLRLSPFLRHWLISYRRSQQNNDGGYQYNNVI